MSPKPFVNQHHDDKPHATLTWRTILVALALSVLIVLASLGIGLGASKARTNTVQPVRAPQALLHARYACPNDATPVRCRSALRKAYAAVEWAKKERRELATNARGYGVDHALRLAAALYGVPLADFKRVAFCESRLDPLARNRSSTATGLMQWLDGSWSTQGLPGFARTDPYASALAAGRAVSRDHGWSQWSCKP